MENRKLEQAAYHESGHVVYTYLNGYACDLVRVLKNTPGEGVSKLNFGYDQTLIAIISNAQEHGEHFNNLSFREKMISPGVAHKIAGILLAGSAAESIYLAGGKGTDRMAVEIAGPDLRGLRNVDFFLNSFTRTHKKDYITQRMAKVLSSMELPELWKAVEALATAVLKSEDLGLLREDIEKILADCGFFEYVKTLRAPKKEKE